MIARAPHAIALETADYIVRTLETGAASEAFREWLADPDTARMLNAPTRHLSAKAVRDYIASFDRVKAHLLGIFEKATGCLIGIRAVYINWPQREFLVNVLIGEKDARNKGARTQSRTASLAISSKRSTWTSPARRSSPTGAECGVGFG